MGLKIDGHDHTAYVALGRGLLQRLLNDLRDREHDRRHPEKRNRPIASGAVSPGTATTTAVLLALAALAIGLVVEPEIAGLVALYGVITAAYSLALKRLERAGHIALERGAIVVLDAVALGEAVR